MSRTSIEWARNADGSAGQTWNPVTGCTRASRGCDNCYAATMTRRLDAMGQEKYAGLIHPGKKHFNGTVKLHPDALDVPLRRKKPATWFAGSMSDLFHPAVPFDFIDRVFAVMALTPQHTYQVLTKRPERMAEYLNEVFQPDARGYTDSRASRVDHAVFDMLGDRDVEEGDPLYEAAFMPGGESYVRHHWPLPNVWLGTSVEDQAAADERVPHLLRCPAAVRFLSCEPLLGPVDLDGLWGYSGSATCDQIGAWPIHWIIVGGESGPKARPMHPDWVRSLRDQCAAAGVLFFFKQWGAWALARHPDLGRANRGRQICFSAAGREQWLPSFPGWATMERVGKKAAGRTLDGRTHDAMPPRAGEEVAHA